MIWKMFFVFLLLVITIGCVPNFFGSDKPIVLQFCLTLDENVYMDTIYGEPPQIAIWLESIEDNSIKNVWVSHRTGADDWIGKAYCDVSLPYWKSVFSQEDEEQVDGLTMATPKSNFIKANAYVPKGSKWNYYIEVNVSGDFNEAFPFRHPDGYPDMQGNGQPSIIYKGNITALEGAKETPIIIGRTEQFQAVSNIISDINGITSATRLLREIKVRCY